MPGWAQNCWLSPGGAGSQNGISKENAYAATSKNAKKCWKQTSYDGTMFILPGTYSKEAGTFWNLDIEPENDGSESAWQFKTLRGLGEVNIKGSRPVPYRSRSRSRGEHWITIKKGASNLWIENFHVERVSHGISALGGGNQKLYLKNLHFKDTRQNITVQGNPKCKKKKGCGKIKSLSGNIWIERTTGLRYSKRHIRLTHGAHHVYVLDSHADAAFQDGDFSVGFDVEGPSSHILFQNCTARRNIYTRSEYWNGDGFKAEKETSEIRWRQCSAFDNTDGGFDIKTPDAMLEDIVALRNGRNIRIWSKGAVLKNVVSAYARHHGGNGSAAGLWVQGTAWCRKCTLHDNPLHILTESANEKRVVVQLSDSILSLSVPAAGPFAKKTGPGDIQLERSVLWRKDATGHDPRYVNAGKQNWNGGDHNFDNLRYGITKGYHFSDPWRFQRKFDASRGLLDWTDLFYLEWTVLKRLQKHDYEIRSH